MVYRLERPADSKTMVYRDRGQYVDKWPDEDQVVRWSAEHEAARGAHAIYQREKKAKRDVPILNALEPMRRTYHQLDRVQAAALLARIVQYITT